MAEHRHYIGLSPEEVARSREAHGLNILTPVEREPLWKLFLSKFKDPLIIILLVAGLLSIGISFYEYFGSGEGAGVFFEPIGIFIAILLATGLAFIFELKAEKEFEVLNKVSDDESVRLIREGHSTLVPRKDVVVGDIVELSAGEEIPADGELMEAVTLQVDESSLTGEPIAHKTVNPDDFDPEAVYPSDMVYRGTKIMDGHGIMRVTAVGDATEIGKVNTSAKIDSSMKTPLDEQLDRLGIFISRASYLVALLIVVGRISMYFASVSPIELKPTLLYALQTLMLAVTLVVVSVPEGLPMAVTLSLAYSMRRMLKTNNLVRKLHACETMGAATVICTDKTGTLTQNRMQVFKADFFGNPPQNLIYEGIAVNSTAALDDGENEARVIGNPTEGALLLWLRDNGQDYQDYKDNVEIVGELPFNTERKYMATLVRNSDGYLILYAKGAPEIIYDLCQDHSGIERSVFLDMLLQYQSQGMRTLGFACQEVKEGERVFESGLLTAGALKLLGIVAISDPVRSEVPAAIKEVLNAGVKVKIVTGDTPATAKEIARQIGLWDDSKDSDRNIVTGPEFSEMDDEQLLGRVQDLKIIARARPLDKKRLVESLQACNEVVAVTGDGTNDAPALKASQVGLSMGDGTSVAKEASDITIIDNSFSSIGRAVMWGRSLYHNIQRFILFQLTVNVAACLVVLCGAFMGLQSPLTVTQMLWVNLIMDTFAAVALASLPPSRDEMKSKPRARDAFIISRGMWNFILATGCIFFIILFIILYYMHHVSLDALMGIDDSPWVSYSGLSPYELSLFFTIFVFLQFWNMFNARAFETGRSAFHLKDCQGFILIASLIFVGQILIVQFGGRFFNVVPLRFTDWVVIIASTSAVLWIGELLRFIGKKRKCF